MGRQKLNGSSVMRLQAPGAPPTMRVGKEKNAKRKKHGSLWGEMEKGGTSLLRAAWAGYPARKEIVRRYGAFEESTGGERYMGVDASGGYAALQQDGSSKDVKNLGKQRKKRPSKRDT